MKKGQETLPWMIWALSPPSYHLPPVSGYSTSCSHAPGPGPPHPLFLQPATRFPSHPCGPFSHFTQVSTQMFPPLKAHPFLASSLSGPDSYFIFFKVQLFTTILFIY